MKDDGLPSTMKPKFFWCCRFFGRVVFFIASQKPWKYLVKFLVHFILRKPLNLENNLPICFDVKVAQIYNLSGFLWRSSRKLWKFEFLLISCPNRTFILSEKPAQSFLGGCLIFLCRISKKNERENSNVNSFFLNLHNNLSTFLKSLGL